MTIININDNRQNPIETLIGAFLAVLAGIILFGLVPGFFIASLVDTVTPLKAGPIWAVTLLSTAAVIFILIKRSGSDFQKAMRNYLIIAACLSGILLIGVLFTQGNIFYGYSATKMFSFLGRQSTDETFEETEIKRRRIIYPDINYDIFRKILTSSNPSKEIQILGFKESEKINNRYFRKYKRDRFIINENGDIEYNIGLNIIQPFTEALTQHGYSKFNESKNDKIDQIQYLNGDKIAWIGKKSIDDEDFYFVTMTR